ncbi:MAG TPA: hypothetical protein PK685_04290 [archaeon]|nr:hypothetical protein [archaeon]
MALRLFKRRIEKKESSKPKSKPKPKQSKVSSKPRQENFHKRYKAFCRRLLKNKIEIIGRNIIEEESSKGPIMIMSTHKHPIETLVYDAIAPKKVFFLSDIGQVISSNKYLRFQGIPGVNNILNLFGTIEINRKQPVKGLRKAIEKSTDILKQDGVLCIFPKGYRGGSEALDRSLAESTSRSSGIYILQKAEAEMKRKIPIIFSKVEYDKTTKKYVVKMEKGYLPENADRKKLALEYIDRIERL